MTTCIKYINSSLFFGCFFFSSAPAAAHSHRYSRERTQRKLRLCLILQPIHPPHTPSSSDFYVFAGKREENFSFVSNLRALSLRPKTKKASNSARNTNRKNVFLSVYFHPAGFFCSAATIERSMYHKKIMCFRPLYISIGARRGWGDIKSFSAFHRILFFLLLFFLPISAVCCWCLAINKIIWLHTRTASNGALGVCFWCIRRTCVHKGRFRHNIFADRSVGRSPSTLAWCVQGHRMQCVETVRLWSLIGASDKWREDIYWLEMKCGRYHRVEMFWRCVIKSLTLMGWCEWNGVDLSPPSTLIAFRIT